MRVPHRCALFLLLPAIALGQQTATKDPTALSIVQQSLTAMGGGRVFQDVQATGNTIAYGDAGAVTYPITLQGTGAASIRSAISKPSGTNTYVTDGTNICADNTPVNLSSDAQSVLPLRRIDFVPALTVLGDYADPNVQVLYVRSDALNGSPVDVIAIGFSAPGLIDISQIPQWFFFIDRATSLVSKIQMTNTFPSPNPQGPTVELVLSQYQVATGFAVPMDQATYMDGVLSQDLQLTSVAFNTGLDSSLFAMTCEVPNAQ